MLPSRLTRVCRSPCVAKTLLPKRWLVRSRFVSTDESNGTTTTLTKNFYSLLDLPQTFSIDDAQLKQNYRNLMNQHHPDKFHQRQDKPSDNDAIIDDNQDHASLVTLAYDTLKRPHARAQHLLALETGLDMESDHQEETQNAEKLVGMETLMEVMELREAIDKTKDAAALAKLLAENQDRIEATSQELENAFEQKDYEAALSLTAKMQYWNRIHETIREKMPY